MGLRKCVVGDGGCGVAGGGAGVCAGDGVVGVAGMDIGPRMREEESRCVAESVVCGWNGDSCEMCVGRVGLGGCVSGDGRMSSFTTSSSDASINRSLDSEGSGGTKTDSKGDDNMLGKADDVADGGTDGMKTPDSAGLLVSTAGFVFFANRPLTRGCSVQNGFARELALSIAPVGGGGPEDRRDASVKLRSDRSNPLSSPRWSSQASEYHKSSELQSSSWL